MKNNKKWLSIVLTAIIVMSVCIVIPAMAQPTPTVTRTILPITISPGDDFLVIIEFTAPQDIEGAGIRDGIQDLGDWNASIEGVTPAALLALPMNNTGVAVIWGTIENGQNVTVMYRLTVPSDAEERDYNFDGKLKTEIWDDILITGADHVTVRVPVTEKPDLVITEKWVCWPDNCTICYNVTNIGNGTALAGHNTTLYVDEVEVAHDQVTEDLEPDTSYTGCFEDAWVYTPPESNITVCADNNETVDESDEGNNCLTNVWVCGDVNKDKAINILDVVKTLNRATNPEFPLACPWAADVDHSGAINILDVVKILNRATNPGFPLACKCKEV